MNMNQKNRKLKYIRYKNKMKNKYPFPKWILTNRKSPFKWLNTNATLLEESWVIDIRTTHE